MSMSKVVSMFTVAVVAISLCHSQACAQGVQSRELASGSYYSPNLRAKFQLKVMDIPGHQFWGARIVSIQSNSPLRQIGLRVGDVITRLDGIRVSDGRHQHFGPNGDTYWAIPQMEQHYSITQVRFIKTGETQVRNANVDLGPLKSTGSLPSDNAP